MSLFDRLWTPSAGAEIHALAARIFPLCRSLTGPGVRETLATIGEGLDLEISEVPTGTRVLDWTIPKEWTLREAHIETPSGARIASTRDSSLHVVHYSTPIRTRLPLAALKERIHTLPAMPDAIPYRTSYYAETWGFCMAHRDLQRLPEGDYDVVIDADLKDGFLTYAEVVHPGASRDEVLITTHVCHPALANDNCSGIALLAHLARALKGARTRYTYRFLFAPGTIGAIAWLARNRERLDRVRHGLVVSGLGDGGGPTYKRSRRGDAVIDRVMAQVMRHEAPQGSVVPFSPYGYDERQYCSPGFDLPVGSLQRSAYGTYPEYHTSRDDLAFIRPEHLGGSLALVARAVEGLEIADARPVSLSPFGEPQLGRRGLYEAMGGDPDAPARKMALLWVLNLADGEHTLLDMAERADTPVHVLAGAARLLAAHGLIDGVDPD